MLLSLIQETRASTQETKAFIQETRSHQKITDAAIRNLETQLGQLAHERAERPTRTFGANSENNLREECKAVMTQAVQNPKNVSAISLRSEKQCQGPQPIAPSSSANEP